MDERERIEQRLNFAFGLARDAIADDKQEYMARIVVTSRDTNPDAPAAEAAHGQTARSVVHELRKQLEAMMAERDEWKKEADRVGDEGGKCHQEYEYFLPCVAFPA